MNITPRDFTATQAMYGLMMNNGIDYMSLPIRERQRLLEEVAATAFLMADIMVKTSHVKTQEFYRILRQRDTKQ